MITGIALSSLSHFLELYIQLMGANSVFRTYNEHLVFYKPQ